MNARRVGMNRRIFIMASLMAAVTLLSVYAMDGVITMEDSRANKGHGKVPNEHMALNQDVSELLGMVIWGSDLAARGEIISIGADLWNTSDGLIPTPYQGQEPLEYISAINEYRIVDIEIVEYIKTNQNSVDCDYITMSIYDGPAEEASSVGSIGDEILVIGDIYTVVAEPSLSRGDERMFELMNQKILTTGNSYCSIIPEIYLRKDGEHAINFDNDAIAEYADVIDSARFFALQNLQQ